MGGAWDEDAGSSKKGSLDMRRPSSLSPLLGFFVVQEGVPPNPTYTPLKSRRSSLT